MECPSPRGLLSCSSKVGHEKRVSAALRGAWQLLHGTWPLKPPCSWRPVAIWHLSVAQQWRHLVRPGREQPLVCAVFGLAFCGCISSAPSARGELVSNHDAKSFASLHTCRGFRVLLLSVATSSQYAEPDTEAAKLHCLWMQSFDCIAQ